jgi:PilZ domain
MQDRPAQVVPRRCERASARFPVTLLAECHGQPLQGNACTIDVSQCGIRIQTDVPLSLDQPLFLFQKSGEIPLMCCRVAWVQKSLPMRHREVGLEILG